MEDGIESFSGWISDGQALSVPRDVQVININKSLTPETRAWRGDYRLEVYSTLGVSNVLWWRQQSSIGILPVGRVAANNARYRLRRPDSLWRDLAS